MNNQHDHMDEKDIRPPKRMPEVYWEMYLIDNSNNKKRRFATTQNRK